MTNMTDNTQNNIEAELMPQLMFGGGLNKSSYEYNNPGKPVPPPMVMQGVGDGQYYQTMVQLNGQVEDVKMRMKI